MPVRNAVIYAPRHVAIVVLILLPTIGARPAAKDRHMGKQADGKGDWKDCRDVPAREPKPIKLGARYDKERNVVTISADLDRVAAVYGAAFAECFMDDADENRPPASDYNQSHDTTLAYAVVRVRPTAEAFRMKDATLPRGSGYFVADYNVRVILKADVFKSRRLGRLSVDHSALLWHGMDDDGHPYVALFDLRNFPQTSQVAAATDLRLITSGNWIERQYEDRRTASFARFGDPVRHLLPKSGTHRGPATERDGSLWKSRRMQGMLTAWMSCDPGCCGSTNLSAF